MIKTLVHRDQPVDRWRDGVLTRMRVSALTGSHQLCIFEQFCDPGLGAPTHLHAVEEVLEIVDGEADIWVGDRTVRVAADMSVVIPAGVLHGFRNVGTGTLHVRATMAASMFEASYHDRNEASRRWIPAARP